MHVVVCVKQVPDPEVPPRDFAIDPGTRRPVAGRAALVMSTFDEIALEVGLRLRDAGPGVRVSAVSVGPASVEEVLRRALAMQADAAVRVEVPDLDPLDPVQTAAALADAVGRLSPVDVVLCGRQAADTDAGQVGLLLAEMLGWPAVTQVILAHRAGEGRLRVEREAEDGTEVVEVELPAVLTATNAEANLPRIPKVRDVMAAHRKPIQVLTPSLAAELRQWAVLEDLYVPTRESRCRMVEGDSPEAKVDALLRELRQLRVL